MHHFKGISIVLLIFVFYTSSVAQIKDSTTAIADSIARAKAQRKKLYSAPRKAAFLSAVLPGAGQIYNRKYWKLPIVYAGLGGFGYMFYTNNTQYLKFRKQVIAANDDNPNTTYDQNYTPDQLQTQKLYYRKFRDFAVFGFGIVYLINIIDASVDAHLKTFDVSDDLSMNIKPWYNMYNANGSVITASGISLKFNFK